MMKNCCLAILLLTITTLTASAQKWQAGSFTDAKGIRQTGFINPNPKGKGPVKEEAFIEYKLDDKMNPIKLSAGELRSFTIGRDSFVVAHAPGNTMWAGKELDFVQVVLNEEINFIPVRAQANRAALVYGRAFRAVLVWVAAAMAALAAAWVYHLAAAATAVSKKQLITLVPTLPK
ncbi:hypothetical protein LJ707_01535 [Mucilaginibacter sp. UR6-1]|uniref:hypothetical protein n=1 Tax=Mucilaginibacter sp. UR6-1 TaxID=1435643 RepID=UPI001E383135|nr:hypothetical protein [Mucilaginibacter sp. UR6-1]MCC8407594.1 hypothetical protein [Mucilaginibacter sp. UR6-1]